MIKVKDSTRRDLSEPFNTGVLTCGPWPTTELWAIGYQAAWLAGQCAHVCSCIQPLSHVHRHKCHRHLRQHLCKHHHGHLWPTYVSIATCISRVCGPTSASVIVDAHSPPHTSAHSLTCESNGCLGIGIHTPTQTHPFFPPSPPHLGPPTLKVWETLI